ncbi:MAG: hypothetical protein SPK16_10640, partial [Corynebacterium sp.]|nr:hypothetical protein [Corynebacterium sp.]
RHGSTIHPKLIQSINHRHSIAEFSTEIEIVYELRNRCAHHEPLVKQNLSVEKQKVDRAMLAIERVSSWISPQASRWILANSRVYDVYLTRPQFAQPLER